MKIAKTGIVKKQNASRNVSRVTKKISLLEEFNNYLLLSVPTRFIRDWITSRYLDQILQIVRVFKKGIIRIEFNK